METLNIIAGVIVIAVGTLFIRTIYLMVKNKIKLSGARYATER